MEIIITKGEKLNLNDHLTIPVIGEIEKYLKRDKSKDDEFGGDIDSNDYRVAKKGFKIVIEPIYN